MLLRHWFYLRLIVEHVTIDGFAKIQYPFQHAVRRVPAGWHIEEDFETTDVDVDANRFKLGPSLVALFDMQRDLSNVVEKLGQRFGLGVRLPEFDIFQEFLNRNVDNVSDAGDVTLLMRPIDTSVVEKNLELFDHPVVVRGAVRGDTIDFIENIVFFNNSHELLREIEPRMFPV